MSPIEFEKELKTKAEERSMVDFCVHFHIGPSPFKFLGVAENELPGLGLTKVESGGGDFWTPKI
jgi:hypothetical protein